MKRRLMLVLWSLIFVLTQQIVLSETLASFQFTGKLNDASGVSFGGTAFVTMTASLFAEATGGEPSYVQVYNSVEIEEGFFSIEIGPALPALFLNPYLELQIQGQILSPRRELSIMPFALESKRALEALNAEKVQGLTLDEMRSAILQDLGVNISKDGQTSYSVDELSTNQIVAQTGIFIDLEADTLVAPQIHADTVEALKFVGDGSALTGLGKTSLITTGNSSIRIESGNGKIPDEVVLNLEGTDRIFVTTAGMGIGIPTPSVPLHVKGTVSADSYAGDGSALTGVLIKGQPIGAPRISASTLTVDLIQIGKSELSSDGLIKINSILSSGTITANAFSGDGSNLSNVLHPGDRISTSDSLTITASKGVALTLDARTFNGSDDPKIEILRVDKTGKPLRSFEVDSEGDILAMDASLGNLKIRGNLTHVSSVTNGPNSSTHINLGISSITGAVNSTDAGISIGGGNSNKALASFASIGAGLNNLAKGFTARVGGGEENQATGRWSYVGGGKANLAGSDFSSVIGGRLNTASGFAAVVAGGNENQAAGRSSFVGAGISNIVSSDGGAIIGGFGNRVAGKNSVVLGGKDLTISSDNTIGFNGLSSSAAIAPDMTGSAIFLVKHFGVGTTKPSTQFLVDLAGDLNVRGRIFSNGESVGSGSVSTSTTSFLYSQGNVGLGARASNPQNQLVVDGALQMLPTSMSAGFNGTIRWNGQSFEAFVDQEWVRIETEPTTASNNTTDRRLARVSPGMIFGFTDDHNDQDGFNYLGMHLEFPDTFSQLSSIPRTNANRSKNVVFREGHFYLAGGFNGTGPTNRLDIYNLERNTWSSGSSMPQSVSDNVLILHKGEIYSLGGETSSGLTSEVFRYSPVNDSWSTISHLALPSPRKGGAGFSDGNFIYYAGGDNGTGAIKDFLKGDPLDTSFSWSHQTEIPEPWAFGPNIFHYNRLFLLGNGVDDSQNVYQYETASYQWSQLSTANGLSTSGVAFAFEKEIFVLGGSSNRSYNIEQNYWSEISDSNPYNLFDASYAQTVSRGYIFGGSDEDDSRSAYEFLPSLTVNLYSLSDPKMVGDDLVPHQGIIFSESSTPPVDYTYLNQTLSSNATDARTLHLHQNTTGGTGADLWDSVVIFNASTSSFNGFENLGRNLDSQSTTDQSTSKVHLHLRNRQELFSLAGVYEGFRSIDGDSGLFTSNSKDRNTVEIRSGGIKAMVIRDDLAYFGTDNVYMDGQLTLGESYKDDAVEGTIRWNGDELQIRKSYTWKSLSDPQTLGKYPTKIEIIYDSGTNQETGDTYSQTNNSSNLSGRIEMMTGSSRRMIITSDGNVGIGEFYYPPVTEKLEVDGHIKSEGIKFPDGSFLSESVAFHAHLTSTASIAASASATLIFDGLRFSKPISSFNSSSGEFTAPSTGLFQFTSQVQFSAGTTGSTLTLKLIKSSNSGFETLSTSKVFINDSTAHSIQIGGFLRELNSGERVWLEISHTSTAAVTILNSLDQTYFQGYRVRGSN